MRRFAALLVVLIALGSVAGAAEEGWQTLFDGKSLNGWKASENEDSWTVRDGALVCHGPRSHLFYVGDDKPFVNFEFQAEVMTMPNSNSGIYFHSRFQEEGWPKFGFEAQVNNTYKPDPVRTGSLYHVVNVTKAPAKDNEWFKYNIRVEGRRVVISINDKVTVDYTEPKVQPAGDKFTRKLDQGTFALQAHDPKSKVKYRNVIVRRLP